MPEKIEFSEGVYLSSVEAGAMIDLETRHHHYWIEYLGLDQALISGHPSLCPTPVLVRLHGSSMGRGGTLIKGFIGRGMHLVFQRPDDALPVTTSEIVGVQVFQLTAAQ